MTLRPALCLLIVASSGCWSQSASEVVVYTALDAEFSQPIFDGFQKETGVTVRAKFDTESTKTLGLTTAIVAEAGRPRGDVFWNNEIVNTLRLKEKGLLDVYQPPAAKEYPELFRDPQGQWHGFAARARVLIVNTNLVPPAERPQSIHDLADRRWRGKIGIAKPLFGTTATHAACLFAVWGDDPARAFFRELKDNQIQILSGNKQVALAVAGGQLAFGLTDTDDAIIELEKGHPVEIVYPDRGSGDLGTLFIPNTLAILKNCPHPAEARRLVDYLLSSDVEVRLARGPSAQIPLHAAVDPAAVRIETPRTVKAMPVDFSLAAKQWDAVAKFLEAEFTGE